MSYYGRVGAEISVNTTTAGPQSQSHITRLTDGSVLVTWLDGAAVRAQRFQPDGTPIGTEQTLYSSGNLISQTVSALPGGGFVAAFNTWNGVKVQRFDANVAPVGAVVSVTGLIVAYDLDIATLANGGFAVSWYDSRTSGGDVSGYGVRVSTYDAGGAALSTDVLVNTSVTGNQEYSKISALSGGGYVVTWTQVVSGNWSTKGQIFSPTGVKIGGELAIAAPSSLSAVTGLSNGGFAVAWSDFTTTTTKIQIFSATGVAVGGQISVPIFGGSGNGPEITALSNGGIAIAWEGNSGVQSDGSGTAIYVQAFDANFLPMGDIQQANSQGNGDQSLSSLTALDGGAFMVSWTDLNTPNYGNDDEIRAQIFAPLDPATLPSVVTITSGGGGDAATINVVENGAAATLVTALPASTSQSIQYTIVGGADAGKFTINATTGQVIFLSAPDFEAPTDTNGDNVYELVVMASDGTLSDTQALNLVVTDGNDAPVMISPAAFSPLENGIAVGTLVAQDPEGDAVTYRIVSGSEAVAYSDPAYNYDSSKFYINTTTGALTFATAPNFEAPADYGSNGVYNILVRATDAKGNVSAIQAITITVGNVLEGTTITSNGGGATAAFSIAENQIFATTVFARDATGPSITYSISGGADASKFTINASTGVLNFVTAPDYEVRSDFDLNRVFEVTVAASDGQVTDTQVISITITNVNEAPVITSNGGGATASVSLTENSTFPGMVNATDPENNPLTYSIIGGADASKFTVGSGALTFISAPNFEAPGDANGDNVYEVIVQVSDGSLTDTQAISVTITNVNEAPVITSSASFSVQENTSAVGTVVATDPEGTPRIYSIAGGTDAARFTIDAGTGVLSFVSAPNYEAPTDSNSDNVYQVIVKASDGSLNTSQTVNVTVTNIFDSPEFTTPSNLGAYENSTAVGAVAAVDPNNLPVTYSISGGVDAARFTINAQTGAIAFVASPNFEAPVDTGANNVYNITVAASNGSQFGSQNLAIAVTNVNEAPVITSNGGGDTASVSIAENSVAFITTVASTDPEFTTRSYSILGGADAAKFTISSTSGQLSFVTARNYEAPSDSNGDNIYEVIVRASDGALSDTQTILVSVTNVNEAPIITSNGGGDTASISVNENTTAVVTVSSTDPENTARIYSIVGGFDAAKFTIDASTGALSFIAAPNFEAPADAGANNVYDVTVRASDGTLSDTQAIAVTVANANDAPIITSNFGADSASIAVNENTTAVVTVTSTDPENTPRTYSIAGGADAAKFTINASTGALSLIAAPNFEAPADAGADNVYEVTVRASDGTLSDTQELAVKIVNVNEAPAITSGSSFSVAENQTLAAAIAATDPEGTNPAFAITGGADAALFSINATTGALSFITAPNFEAPADAGADNVYNVTVRASDGTLSDTKALTISVSDTNEPVVITSNGGGASAALAVAENATGVSTVIASDPENASRSYAIAGGADAALFTIDATTGVLSFIAAPDFEAPGDAGANNVYDVIVSASDGVTVDTQALAVTVTDVNEPLVITSNGGGDVVTLSVSENATAVSTITSVDPDGTAPIYSITGGADAALFTIDAATGALAFVSAPNFEAPTDAGANNVYDVIVSAGDGVFTDSQAIAVTVTNTNEGLSFTSGTAFAVGENATIVATVSATDLDGDAVSYAIAGGADAALFAIDAATGVLSFIAAPDYEAPGDAGADNIYDVVVSATDGSFTATSAIAITVGNVNEGLSITSGTTFGVAENSTSVTTLSATDIDGDAVTFSITGGADAALFTINAATGALAFISAPDFELPGDAGGDNVYDVVVSATDGAFVDSRAIAVTVGNVNEATAITSNGAGNAASVAAAENGTAVTTVTAIDPDGDPISFAIAGGADAAFFTIDATTGVLSFIAAPDFEAPGDAGGDNVYDVVVQASDGALTDTQALAVTVTNVNEGPTITSSASRSVAENGIAAGAVVATDIDGDALVYAITGGADAALFSIDAVTGEVAFLSAPNFETPGDVDGDNVYEVVVSASDGSLIDTQTLLVTVGNVNEPVTITSQGGGDTAALSVAENGLVVATVTAIDPDGATPSFSIVGGADAARFTIDASTGVLTFVDAPDFEAPVDANADNVYDVIVQASDGSLTDSQAIAVTVSNVNEAPVITSNAGGASASRSVSENGTGVLVVTASDPEGTAISYSIAGGADAGKFIINSATGALCFIAAPDFETPADAGADNVYDVIVQASDGSLTDGQAIAVTVTDANEAPVTSVPLAQTVRTATATYITGISVADVDNGASETVTLTTTLGTVSATASAGASVTGAGTKSLVISGTLAQVNATLASLSYTAATAGSDTIQIATSDGSLSNAASIAVTVNATANHTPTLDGSTVAMGAVTELAATTGSTVVDTATGAIRFTDADAPDTHTLTVSSVTATGTTTGLPSSTTLLTYLIKGTLTEQSGTTPGAAPWTFSAPDKTFDFLNAGQTATLTYVVKLADTHGGFINQTVVVTVTGANDAPIVATGTLTGAITERASLTGSATADTASGLVKFTDADTGDIHTASIAGVVASGVTSGLADTATLLAWFGKGALTEQVGTTAGSLAWSFSAPDSAFDYLAAGEKAILTYTVAITDTAGVTLNQNVTVTITGTSDAPVIDGSTVVSGAVTELAAMTGSVVADTAAGAIRFTDADASDTHTLTVSSVTATGTTTGLPSSTTLLTYLVKGALTEQSGTTLGAAPWTFSAPDKTFDYLNAGQTATLSYVVKLADNHGGFVNQTVVVTVTGTNDAPIVATGTLTGAITERASLTGSTTADTASGLVKFTDADTGDVHTASITGVVASGVTTGLIDNATLLGWLGKGALTEQVGTTAGSLAWSFSAPDSAFDYLAAGEKAILTYTVAITDTAGVTLNQNVTVTVTGTNDKPVAAAHDGLITDNWTPLTVSAATLLGGATDPDLADTLSLSSVQSAVGGTIALVGGNAVFTPTATAIGAGSFTYTISDGHGGTSIATTNLTTTLHQITGTAGNDTLAGGAKIARIDGLDGNDTITAGAAGDKITGGAGSDVLTGGAGSDLFVYRSGFGTDTINSFAATGTKHDVLQFDSNIFSDWAHLLGATQQQGSDLLITLDAANTITLKNVALANFTSADANFV